jgi:hypothetical protein
MTTRRRPCGFCTTGDCQLCRGIFSNGAAAPSGPEWHCPCAASGHPRRRGTARQPGPAAVPVITPPSTVTGPARQGAERVDHCVKCGYDFGRPQARQTCKSATACERRQQARSVVEDKAVGYRLQISA